MKRLVTLALLVCAYGTSSAADNETAPSEQLLALIKNADNKSVVNQRHKIWDLLNGYLSKNENKSFDLEPHLHCLEKMDKKEGSRCRSLCLPTAVLIPVGAIFSSQFPVIGGSVACAGFLGSFSFSYNYFKNNPKAIMELISLHTEKQKLLSGFAEFNTTIDETSREEIDDTITVLNTAIQRRNPGAPNINVNGLKSALNQNLDIQILLIDLQADAIIGK